MPEVGKLVARLELVTKDFESGVTKITTGLANIEQATERNAVAIESAINQQIELMKKLNQQITDQADAQRKVWAEEQKRRTEEAQVRKEQQKAREESSKAAKEAREQAKEKANATRMSEKAIRDEIKAISLSIKMARDDFAFSKKKASDYRDLQTAIKGTLSLMQNLHDANKDVLKSNKSLSVDFQRQVHNLQNLDKAAKKTSTSLYAMVRAIPKNAGDMFSGVFGMMFKINETVEFLRNGLAGLRYVVGGTASAFIEAASKAESFQTRINAVVGSVEKGKEIYKDLETFATSVPATFEEVLQAGATLIPIIKGGREELQHWMPVLSDLSAVSGLTLEETSQNFVKMYSAGAAAADLFRERGINAMLGFLPKVSYTAEETIRIINEKLATGSLFFTGASQRMAATWEGQISMMQDKWFVFRKMLMDNGPFNYLKSVLATINAEFDRFKTSGMLDSTAKSWGEYVTQILRNAVTSLLTLGAKLYAIFTELKAWYSSTVGLHSVISTSREGKKYVDEGLLDEDEFADASWADREAMVNKVRKDKGIAPIGMSQESFKVISAAEQFAADMQAKFDATLVKMEEQKNAVHYMANPGGAGAVAGSISKDADAEETKRLRDAALAGLTGVAKAIRENQFDKEDYAKQIGMSPQELDRISAFTAEWNQIQSERNEANARFSLQEKSVPVDQKGNLLTQMDSSEKNFQARFDDLAKRAGTSLNNIANVDLVKSALDKRLKAQTAAYSAQQGVKDAQRGDQFAEKYRDKYNELATAVAGVNEELDAVGKTKAELDTAKIEKTYLRMKNAAETALDGKLDSKMLAVLDEWKAKSLALKAALRDEAFKNAMKDLDAQLNAVGLSAGEAWSVEMNHKVEEMTKSLGLQSDQVEALKQKYTDLHRAQKLYEMSESVRNMKRQFDVNKRMQDRGAGDWVGQMSDMGESTRAAWRELNQNDPAEVREFRDKLLPQMQAMLAQQTEYGAGGSIIGGLFGDTAEIDSFNSALEALIPTLKELGANTDEFRTKMKDSFKAASIKRDVTEFIGAVEAPMSDFLMTFAETGALAFGELEAAIMKQLRMIVAEKTTKMLMTALEEGVYALVSYASGDTTKAGKHLAAAGQATAAAGAFAGFLTGIHGQAHDGMTSIPREGTWILDGGERVVSAAQNKDLTSYLQKQDSSSPKSVNVNIRNESGQELKITKSESQSDMSGTVIDIVIDGIARNRKGLRDMMRAR